MLILTASLLLHLLVFSWAGSRIGLPSWQEPEPNVITTEIRTIAAASEAPATATPAKRGPASRPARRPAPIPGPESPALPIADDIPFLPPVDTETSIAGHDTANETAAVDVPGAAAPATDIPAPPVVHETAQAENDPAHFKVNPPPSAELLYEVRALRDGQTTYGHGKIRWHAEGGKYSVNGDAGVLMFLTLLTFRSEGMIDESGIAPVVYAEKRFRRAETNTHFHRERDIISFSASTASYPRKGGEQDRASVIWQLAAIGRGDGTRFAPQAEIELFVAGVRDGETWRLRVIGEENTETDYGTFRTWHIVRTPRRSSYDDQLDIWLAPERQWYPVKLRFSERNGDYLELSLSNVNDGMPETRVTTQSFQTDNP